MQTGKLQQLQILRYLAAIMVAVAHSIYLLEAKTGAAVLERAHQFGLTAVNIFFLISGFIMVYTSRDEFAVEGSPLRFLQKRMIRIVPIYALVSMAAFIVATFGSDGGLGCRKNDPLYLLASLAFVPMERCDGVLQPILTQGWTLNYEVFFYVVFAATLFVPLRRALILLAAVFGGLVSAASAFPSLTGSSELLMFYTDAITLLFVAGAAIGALYLKTGPLTRVGKPFVFLLILFVAVMAGQEAAFEASLADRQTLALAGSLLLVSAALFMIDRNVRFDGCESVVGFLGDASYSIYLVHGFVLTALKKLWDFLGAWPLGWAVFMAAYLTTCSISGGLMFRLIEKPITTRLRRSAGLSSRKPAQVVA